MSALSAQRLRTAINAIANGASAAQEARTLSERERKAFRAYTAQQIFHKILCIIPLMEAGIAEHAWTLVELLQ